MSVTKQSINEKNFKKRIKEELNIDIDKTIFVDWSWEKMEFIFRKVWWDILKYCKDNDLTLRNIVAIMGKDTRKTTVWIIFAWFLMTKYEWLNAFLLRDTIDKATSQMKSQVRKAVSLITKEYDVKNFESKVYESNDGFYLKRTAQKDNQKVELLSFDKIVELGGFTTNNGSPAIFIYDELQNPHSSNKKIISKEKFIANYKFIEKKNKGIEISTKNILPKWIPRHLFLSNRYIAIHPLNIFAEEHLPYYEHEVDGKIIQGVRSWMLKDPLNNNFIFKYIGKDEIKDEWKDLWGTGIIYGSALSNEILRMDKEWEEEQIEAIKRGNPEDLAYVIGDLYEGNEDKDNAYKYTNKQTISRETFEEDYAKYVDSATIAIDLDFSRQIRIRPKYNASKYKTPEVKIYRTIREKAYPIKCHGVSDDGRLTEIYINQTYKKLLEISEYIYKKMPKVKKVKILFDDKKAQWVGRFNIGEFKNNFWNALKVNFDQKWRIWKRPHVIDEMQDTGFVIDIDDPSNTFFHINAANVKIKEGSKPKVREEKDNDSFIDDLNTDEYGLYYEIPKMAWNNRATRLLGGKNEWR